MCNLCKAWPLTLNFEFQSQLWYMKWRESLVSSSLLFVRWEMCVDASICLVFIHAINTTRVNALLNIPNVVWLAFPNWSLTCLQIQTSIQCHAIIILPNTDGIELLVCYEDEGVYVNTYGRITKDVVLQWGEMPTSVGKSLELSEAGFTLHIKVT